MLNELENIDSQNDEQENTDSTNSDDTTTDNSEDESKEGEQEEYTEREKQLYARLKKAEGFELVDGKWVKPEKKSTPKPKKESSNDEVTMARLEARGVLHPDDQAYILKFAKVEGIHYLEALEDEIVKDKLDRNKKQRLSASANPRGNNRAPGEQNELASAIKKYEKDGTLPDSPALTSKLLKALRNR